VDGYVCFSRSARFLGSVALLAWNLALAPAQTPNAQPFEHRSSPLTLHQTRYRLRAGEPVKIDAPRETLDFLLHAKTRRVEIAGKEIRGFVVGPNRAGDQILLGVSLTMKPGEYRVSLSTSSNSGEERVTTLNVTLDPMQTVPITATQPPVVLLNGWQIGIFSGGCPQSSSSETFGNLESSLTAPVVYFFDNCVECPNCLIEDLGNDLGQVLGMIRYDDGTLVPQIDLVTHSMGGLIARAYLAGLQANGALSPPPDPRVRKIALIAEPNFGSYKATALLGSQTAEMIPGSPFLWELATWNQRSDDLRGVGALAVVGNAGSGNGQQGSGDGIVSLTSASLAFARDPSATRILPYCHTDTTLFANPTLGTMDCSGNGIAKAPETAQIVGSFLTGTSDWMSIGGTPTTDPYLSKYGGLYFAVETAASVYLGGLDVTSVFFGNVDLQSETLDGVFYNEFIAGSDTFRAASTSLGQVTYGPVTIPTGHYNTFRAKFSTAISGVSPLMGNTQGWVVQSGATITIYGVGFGPQQCSGCQVFASGIPLQVSASAWSDASISAYLPATFTGLVTIFLQAASGSDSINIMAALPSAIAVAPTGLQFAYTSGGPFPSAQSIQVTNSGGSVLAFTAAAGTASGGNWLAVTSNSTATPATLTVAVDPTGLTAGTYTGTVQISAAGGSNTPLAVPVTLTVAPASASLAVAPEALTFNYTVSGAIPAAKGVSITNTGGGALSWAASSGAPWVGLSPSSGTAPATLSVSVNPASLSAGIYTASVQIMAAGTTNSPASLSVTLLVQAAATPSFMVGLSTAGQVEPFAAQAIVSAYGTNLATGTASAVGLPLPTSLDDTSVTVKDSAGVPRLAALFYVSPSQVNFEMPAGMATGAALVSIQNQTGTTQTATVQIANVSPGLFALNGSGLVAALVLQVISGNQQPLQPVYQISSGHVVPMPISLGPSSEQVYLEMYGTGIRNATSVTATVGGVSLPVLYAGAAPGFAGEDQVNIGPLPQSLAGKGSVNIVLTADGQAANTVDVTIQ
jgi:uncharacterized protein (TIGR03437 family)